MQTNPDHSAFRGVVLRQFKSTNLGRHDLRKKLDAEHPSSEVENDDDIAANAGTGVSSVMSESSDSAADDELKVCKTSFHQCDRCKRIFHRVDVHIRHVSACNGRKTADNVVVDPLKQWLEEIRPAEVDSPTTQQKATAENWSEEALLRRNIYWGAKKSLQLPEEVRKALTAIKQRDKATEITTPVTRVMEELGAFLAQSWDTRYITTIERITSFFSSFNQKERASRATKKRRATADVSLGAAEPSAQQGFGQQ